MPTEGAGQVTGTVLAIDGDDAHLVAVAALLAAEGLTVQTLSDADGIVELLAAVAHDLVLVDLAMPGMRGADALRTVRRHTDAPVIVVSARASEPDRVLALELGADDYIVKPYSERELVARVRARLRRPPARRTVSILGDEELQIDLPSREVRLAAQPVALAAREFDLLVCLASNPRQVLSREDLLAKVWGSSGQWQAAATVTEHVHRLRSKIGAHRIVTVRGAGYRFEPARRPAAG